RAAVRRRFLAGRRHLSRGSSAGGGFRRSEIMKKICCYSICSLALWTATSFAQETSTLETGPDGNTYRVTRRVTQRTVPHTEYQSREQKVYHPQVKTDYQTYQQTYVT